MFLSTNLKMLLTMKTITKLFKNNHLAFFFLACCISYGQSMATYTITFTGTWNSSDHTEGGTMFPSNDHWSNLVGATHNSNITIWETGQMASQGIEDVAETGSNSVFEGEINDAITAGDADQWLQEAFSPNMADGMATIMSITISEDFPLLTLITMIAPSPDWFAGIHGVSLRNEGNWESSISLDLFPYDAGTENGTAYSTSNSDTSPQDNITNITSVNPFNNQKVGTLAITLETVLNTPSNDFKTGIKLSPNPTQGIVTISNATSENINSIEVFDVIGKSVKKVSLQSTKTRTQLDLRDLNTGIYLVKLNSSKGNSSLKKLVIK